MGDGRVVLGCILVRRLYLPFTLRRSSLTAGVPGSCFYGAKPPLGYRTKFPPSGGGTPRTKFPPLGGGTPRTKLPSRGGGTPLDYLQLESY